MEYKYKLAKLQYDKEKIEELIAQQSSRVGQVFPKKMEEVFWQKNLERSRKHIEKNLWSGVLVYFKVRWDNPAAGVCHGAVGFNAVTGDAL